MRPVARAHEGLRPLVLRGRVNPVRLLVAAAGQTLGNSWSQQLTAPNVQQTLDCCTPVFRPSKPCVCIAETGRLKMGLLHTCWVRPKNWSLVAQTRKTLLVARCYQERISLVLLPGVASASS